MFRGILSSRDFIIGLVFFAVIVTSSLLYNRHVRHVTQEELARTQQIVQPHEHQNESDTTQDNPFPNDTGTQGHPGMHVETDDSQAMLERKDTLRIDDMEGVDSADPFLLETTSKRKPARCAFHHSDLDLILTYHPIILPDSVSLFGMNTALTKYQQQQPMKETLNS